MKKILILFVINLLFLTGCNSDNPPENSKIVTSEASESTASTTKTEAVTTKASTAATTIAETKEITETAAPSTEEQAETEEVIELIPKAEQTPRIEGNRLSYTLQNVYSDSEYYRVDISCIKIENMNLPEFETTLIEGSVYGDFRLDLYQNDTLIDTLKINIPNNNRFLLFENILQNLSYGCEILSNLREYGVKNYPDLIQLDFYIPNEAEAPQYARFFAVSNKKLTELSIYSYGREIPPFGTHLMMTSPGVMIQQMVIYENYQYVNVQFEYTYNPAEMTLNRKRVPHSGFSN